MNTSPNSNVPKDFTVDALQPLHELELVSLVKQGKIEAFDELIHRYGAKIFRLTYHITGNREDAEDAMQEAFLKSFSHLPQFQANSKFYTWLVRIAVNESLMKLRKRKGNMTLSLDEEIQMEDDSMPREFAAWDENPEQKYARQELRGILDGAVDTLSAPLRTVFILRDLDELSTEETAEALNLSIPAVKSRLLRARLQLREILAKHFHRGNSRE
ncbi:MAG: RNA polymerase subunit sigma-24 [Acidobacteria bacterium RIFCSPLOWO2_12_FULL_54_10]|nr:MAG: RNA polymerase subunit sigma-24 [Acidobacteria bacterium RIFCSPLOWO2_12_FULL_54_10]